jgi:hypothetical protein
MSSASDTPAERLAEYDQLFATALTYRRRTSTGVLFTFRAGSGVLEWVEDLSEREAACCPFMAYKVESDDRVVVWTITSDDPAVRAILDEVYRLPDHPEGGYDSLLTRLGPDETGRIELRFQNHQGRPTRTGGR